MRKTTRATMRELATALGLSLGLATGAVQAALVTGIDDGVVITVPSVNERTNGPRQIGTAEQLSIEWYKTPPPVPVDPNDPNDSNNLGNFGWTGHYGLGLGEGNGLWIGEPAFFGLNSKGGTMTWKFNSGPVSAVGGLLNFAPIWQDTFRMAVYDANHNLLESYALTVDTPNQLNAGQFYGVVRPAADIVYFEVSDWYAVLRNLTVLKTFNVPEPASLALFGLGLAGLAVTRRRKQ